MPDFILKVLEDRSTQLILRYTAIGCAWVSSKMHCTISDMTVQELGMILAGLVCLLLDHISHGRQQAAAEKEPPATELGTDES